MGEMNFMTAGTEIEGYVNKYNQCLDKIAALTASACVERAKKGKINDGLKNDIYNLIKSLPVEDQAKVLLQVAVELSKALSSPKQPTTRNASKPDMSSIFSSRGF